MFKKIMTLDEQEILRKISKLQKSQISRWEPFTMCFFEEFPKKLGEHNQSHYVQNIFDYIKSREDFSSFPIDPESLQAEINLLLGCTYLRQGEEDIKAKSFQAALENLIKAQEKFTKLPDFCGIKNFYIAKVCLRMAKICRRNIRYKYYKRAKEGFENFIAWDKKTDISKASLQNLCQYYGFPIRLIEIYKKLRLGFELQRELLFFSARIGGESKAFYRRLLVEGGWYSELLSDFRFTKTINSKRQVIKIIQKIRSSVHCSMLGWYGIITTLSKNHYLAPDFKQTLLTIRNLIRAFLQPGMTVYFSNMKKDNVVREILLYLLSPWEIKLHEGRKNDICPKDYAGNLCGIASVVQLLIRAFPVKFVDMVLDLAIRGKIEPITKRVNIGKNYSSIIFALLVYLKEASTWLTYKPITAKTGYLGSYYESFTGITFPYTIEKLLKEFGFTNIVSTIDLSGAIPKLSKLLSCYPYFHATKHKYFNSKRRNLEYVIKRIQNGSYCVMLGKGKFFESSSMSKLTCWEVLKLAFAHYVVVEKLEIVNETVNLYYADNCGNKKNKEIPVSKFLPHYYGCIVADTA